MRGVRRALAALVVAGAFATQVGVAAAKAEAPCTHRSAAHIAQHGGIDTDSAWHVSHGDLPNCGGDDAAGNTRDDDHHEADEPASHHDDEDDGKSRFCRRHWYC